MWYLGPGFRYVNEDTLFKRLFVYSTIFVGIFRGPFFWDTYTVHVYILTRIKTALTTQHSTLKQN